MQWLVGLGALALIAFYLGVFRPLSSSSALLEKPLEDLSRKLEASGGFSGFPGRPDLAGLSNSLQQVESALAGFDAYSQTALERVQPEPELEARLSEPFRLIDFYYERQHRLERLRELSQQGKVEVQPGVISGYPDYRLDVAEPVMLWAQLSLTDRLVASAIGARVSRIVRVELSPLRAHAQPGAGGRGLEEIPILIELTGGMGAVARFVAALPLLEPEREQAGLPQAGGPGPALFIERLNLRKVALEQPDQVHLELAVSGFVQRR